MHGNTFQSKRNLVRAPAQPADDTSYMIPERPDAKRSIVVLRAAGEMQPAGQRGTSGGSP
jgi:hypothetical protein